MVYKITSYFGDKESFRSSGHKGIDFYMDEGTPLRSIQDGTIQKIVDYGDKVNAGKCVMVKWEDGKTAIYGHLSRFGKFHEGDTVHVGDVIGYSGHTGEVVGQTGNHLHFGLKEGGKYLNPSSYIENIQHMNDPNFIAQTAQSKITFMSYFQQHMDLLGSHLAEVKLQFIHFLVSTDYLPVIQLLKSIVQFIFLNT